MDAYLDCGLVCCPPCRANGLVEQRGLFGGKPGAARSLGLVRQGRIAKPTPTLSQLMSYVRSC